MNISARSELIHNFFTGIADAQNHDTRRALEGDFSGAGKYSPLTERFLENNEELFSTILPEFIRLLGNEGCTEEIIEIEKRHMESEIEAHYADLEDENADHRTVIALIEIKEEKLKRFSIKAVEEDAGNIFESTVLPLLKDPHSNQTERNYFYLFLLKIEFRRFLEEASKNEKYSRTHWRENLIYKYYSNIEIDIRKSDLQFSKYDLYTINEDCEIFVAVPSRVIDHKNKIQFIVEIPEELLEMLDNLKKEAQIKDLALLAKSQRPIESDQHISILLGNYQQPTPPKIQDVYYNNFTNVLQDTIKSRMTSEDRLFFSDAIYRFHEASSDDAIWVFSSGNSVEFEEILESPEILDNCVVTQLVHLEYLKENQRIKISHIDHEFIFYSHDEFSKRLEDHNQKGAAKKRIKTFKIDNSRMPLILEDGTFSLYTVLEAFFSKAYLVQDFLVKGCGIRDVMEMVSQKAAK
ncbi:hypothetical protein E7V67_013410 [[Empedobacter] haloabium]|uniref:Uncharacterized protein n=1 Tax=[Empedobacter] haloabium TaxID=592317 RepID=A0ABZ1UTL8_9BURK